MTRPPFFHISLCAFRMLYENYDTANCQPDDTFKHFWKQLLVSSVMECLWMWRWPVPQLGMVGFMYQTKRRHHPEYHNFNCQTRWQRLQNFLVILLFLLSLIVLVIPLLNRSSVCTAEKSTSSRLPSLNLFLPLLYRYLISSVPFDHYPSPSAFGMQWIICFSLSSLPATLDDCRSISSKRVMRSYCKGIRLLGIELCKTGSWVSNKKGN